MTCDGNSSSTNGFHHPAPAAAQAAQPDRRTLYSRTSRDLAERLVALAPHLPPEEQALIERLFADGRTAADTARLTGRSARSIRAQAARIMARTADPLFAWVLLHEEALPPSLRAVARGCILHGRPLRAVARELGLTYHQARAIRQSIVTLARSRIVSARSISPAPTPRREGARPRASAEPPPRRARPRAPWRTTGAPAHATTLKGEAP